MLIIIRKEYKIFLGKMTKLTLIILLVWIHQNNKYKIIFEDLQLIFKIIIYKIIDKYNQAL